MTLSIGAQPTIVAREVGVGSAVHWSWLIAYDEVGALRMRGRPDDSAAKI